MTPEKTFRIPIVPMSLQTKGARAKIVRAGNRQFIKFHATPEGEAYKNAVSALIARHRPLPTPLEGPLGIALFFVMPRPAALYRKKDPAGRVWCIARPDEDNLRKGLLDIFTKARFWPDDSHVSCSYAFRCYARKDEKPCIEVMIWKLPPYAPSLLASLFQ